MVAVCAAKLETPGALRMTTRRGLLPDKDCYDPKFCSGFFLTLYQACGEEAVSGVESWEGAQVVVRGLVGKEAVCGSGV